MKFILKKRNPNYLPLFLTIVIIGSAMSIIMFVLLMQINGKDIGVFQVFLSLIVSVPSVILAYIFTIAALRTEKGLSPFAAGVIGGLSSCFIALIVMSVLPESSILTAMKILGVFFVIGFIAEVSCFLVASELSNEKAKEPKER